MIRTFARYIGQYKRDAILTPLCTALEVLMEILIPFVTASIIDEGIQAGDMGKVWLYGGLMLALAFLSLFFGAMAGKLGASASSGFAANLRQGMFENIQRYSFSNIDKFSTASLVTRMTTDVTNTQMAFQMSLRIAVRAPLMLLCSMAMCFVISPRLSLVFLAALVVLGVALFGVMGLTLPIFQQVFRRYDDLNASVQENVSGIRTVKAFVREKFENEKFKSAAENLYKLYVKAESILAVNSPVMLLVIYGCILAISCFGARFIVGGTMTTGNLTSLFSYVISMLMSLMMLSMIFVMVAMSMASFRRIMEVLRERPDLVNPLQALTQIADGSIDFDHVYFTYQPGSESYALSDIDLHIKAGETIGIIGGTGCGKSSLVNLISRLYDVSQGAVKVGGKDVRSYDLETLRDNVAVVLQKNVLFSGTILENLRWGKADAALEECEEACRLACADEFIQRFPQKYDTWIDQGGLNVSGGQRQRLCIARALLKSPKVLILDDSTSAVDTATDRKIREAFARHIPGTTKLIISQRVSSIQDADRILVLENGKIAGFGTHEELLEQNKIYREIVEAQTQAGGDFDQPA